MLNLSAICRQKSTKRLKPLISLVPMAGLEPARSFDQRILSPLRLPFRHIGSPEKPMTCDGEWDRRLTGCSSSGAKRNATVGKVDGGASQRRSSYRKAVDGRNAPVRGLWILAVGLARCDLDAPGSAEQKSARRCVGENTDLPGGLIHQEEGRHWPWGVFADNDGRPGPRCWFRRWAERRSGY